MRKVKSPYEQQLIREFFLAYKSHIEKCKRKNVTFTTDNLNSLTDTFCARWDAKWLTNFRECRPMFKETTEESHFDFERMTVQ